MPVGMLDSQLTRHLFSDAAKRIWTETATIQAWLDVEAALARAQAELGLIPAASAEVIAANAHAEKFDLARIADDIAFTWHPFVPVLRQFEEFCGEDHAGYIHWGATTQNIFDTGAALQLRASQTLLLEHLDRLLHGLATLAMAHRDTLQAGRTHGQHALPMVFGFKVAGWLVEMRRHRERIIEAGGEVLVSALGGGIGTFAAMGGKGRAVQARVGALLGLRTAEIPMRSGFDEVAAYLATLGHLAATAQKIGEEIVFLQRTDIAEVEEPHHRGKIGSSTMAQKRNPAQCQKVVSLGRMVRSRLPLAVEGMIQINEGDAAAGNVTETVTPEICIMTISLTETLANVIAGLTVDRAAMRRNLDASGGAIMSEAVMMGLADRLGRHVAHHVLYDVAMDTQATGADYRTVLAARLRQDGLDSAVDIDALLDPANYLGEAVACIEDAAASVRDLPGHPSRQG